MRQTSKILMLYTGGTIGMVQAPDTGALKPFNFRHLLDQIPELEQFDCKIDTDSFDHPIDSSNMHPQHWRRIVQRIADGYDEYDGFVVLHGSDTMAYTSSALSFMLENLAKPVILTGSQLPIGITRSDARENLLSTIEIVLAQTPDFEPRVPEVSVYFEYDLFRGNRIHKISTEDFDAFQSLNYPKLAEAGVHIKYNHNNIRQPSGEKLKIHTSMSNEVAVLTVFPGMHESVSEAILGNPNIRGVILRTFGSGNGPSDKALFKSLWKAVDRGVKVANISQCNGGGVIQGKYEASKVFLEMGILSGGDMTFEAGLTKMMYLLGQDLSHEEFKRLYESDLRGELSPL